MFQSPKTLGGWHKFKRRHHRYDHKLQTKWQHLQTGTTQHDLEEEEIIERKIDIGLSQ